MLLPALSDEGGQHSSPAAEGRRLAPDGPRGVVGPHFATPRWVAFERTRRRDAPHWYARVDGWAEATNTGPHKS